MEIWVHNIGLAVTLAGALVVAVTDAWLSRSLLVYLDVLENNLGKMARALQEGANQVAVSGVNVRRDRGQDRVRAVKTLGWLVLVVGLGLQLTAAWLGKPA